MWHCYLIANQLGNRTYLGITNNTAQRLRQHNGELSGGAKATRAGRPWRFVVIIRGFPDQSTAAKFEWHLRHRERATGLEARISALKKMLELEQYAGLTALWE